MLLQDRQGLLDHRDLDHVGGNERDKRAGALLFISLLRDESQALESLGKLSSSLAFSLHCFLRWIVCYN